MAKKKVSLEIIHPHAAGIDIGSRSHFVAIVAFPDRTKCGRCKRIWRVQ